MTSNADNNIAVSDYIAKEAGRGFYNNALLIPLTDTQYSKEYGGEAGGARKGKSIRVRYPTTYTTTDQVAIDSSTLNALDEETKVLTLDTDVGVHGDVSITQASLELDQGGSEYAERCLMPMGKALNSRIEEIGFKKMALEAKTLLSLKLHFRTQMF